MTDPRVARFSALLAQQPDNELFRFSLAQALEATGQTDEAESHYRACVEARADWMLPRILLGKLLLHTQRPDQAKPLLQEALQLAIAQDHDDPREELESMLDSLD